jgi:uncharacterized protein YcfL
MKKTVLLVLFSLLAFQYGCESHHRDDLQEQQETSDGSADRDIRPQPVSEPERGNTNK